MLERHYRTLGVQPGAGAPAVRAAYRRLVRDWHPDRHRRDPDMQMLAEETLKAVNQAYREIMIYLAAHPTGAAASPAEDRVDRRQAAPHAGFPLTAGFWRRLSTALNAIIEPLRRTATPRNRQRALHPSNSGALKSSAERLSATFDRVLEEVAGKHGLRFTGNRAPNRTKNRSVRVSSGPPRHRVGPDRDRDSGPVSPVDKVGPIAPIRRKK